MEGDKDLSVFLLIFRPNFIKQQEFLCIMIDYHGPQQMRRNIEDFVQKNILPHLARTGVVPFYIGKIVGVSMKPTPHFVFDEEENKKVKEAFQEYLKAEDSEKEKAYRAARLVCLGASSLPENISGGYQQDTDSVAFPPHFLLDYLHILPHVPETISWDALEQQNPKEWEYLINGLNFPHAIAHELVHWELAETRAYSELRAAFAALEDVAQDPLLIQGRLYEILNEALARQDPYAERYAPIAEKIMQLGIYHFNEVIAECAGFDLVPTPHGRIYPPEDTPHQAIDQVNGVLRTRGVKETLAFAKQLMDDAYRTETDVYDLLRRV